MKRTLKTIAIVLLVILLLFAGLAFWQRDNIRSLLDSNQYSSDELEQQLRENEQKTREIIDQIDGVAVRDLTDEEKEELRSGEVSEEELLDRLAEPSAEAPQESEYQKEMARLLAQVYLLRAQYEGELEQMEADIKEEFYALPANERTTANAFKLAEKYIARTYRMERECDEKIDAIVGAMIELVRANGDDDTVPDSVMETYLREKSLKKALYMSKLQERGIAK